MLGLLSVYGENRLSYARAKLGAHGGRIDDAEQCPDTERLRDGGGVEMMMTARPVAITADNTVYSSSSGGVISGDIVKEDFCACGKPRSGTLFEYEVSRLFISRTRKVVFCNECLRQVMPSKESR